MVKESLPRRSGESSDKVVCIAMAQGSAGGQGLGCPPQPSIEFSEGVLGMEPVKAAGGRISWMYSAFSTDPG